MSDISQRDLSPLLRWRPWPPGDPGPEIWRIIQELEQHVQVQVGRVVLETQIAQLRATVEGLEKINGLLGPAAKG